MLIPKKLSSKSDKNNEHVYPAIVTGFDRYFCKPHGIPCGAVHNFILTSSVLFRLIK